MDKSKAIYSLTVRGGPAFDRAWRRSGVEGTRASESKEEARRWFHEGQRELMRLQSANKARTPVQTLPDERGKK
jgi:hypothetical protein